MKQKHPILNIGLSSSARVNKIVIHTPALTNSSICSAGIISRSIERAHEYAKDYDGLKVYDSFEEMIASPEIDVVYISSPNTEHEALSLLALLAGKHVLCEKPLIISPSQLENIKKIARDKRVLFMEAIHYPYHPIMNEFIKHVRSLNLDDIKRLTFYFDFPYPAENDIRHQEALWGGVFAHLGCYVTDLLTRFFDDQVSLSDLVCKRHPVGGADTFCRGSFQHKNQPHMQIDFRLNFLTNTYKAYVELEHAESNTFIENPFGGSVGTPIITPKSSMNNVWSNDVLQKTTYDYQMVKLVELLKDNQTSEINTFGNSLFWHCWEELKKI